MGGEAMTPKVACSVHRNACADRCFACVQAFEDRIEELEKALVVLRGAAETCWASSKWTDDAEEAKELHEAIEVASEALGIREVTDPLPAPSVRPVKTSEPAPNGIPNERNTSGGVGPGDRCPSEAIPGPTLDELRELGRQMSLLVEEEYLSQVAIRRSPAAADVLAKARTALIQLWLRPNDAQVDSKCIASENYTDPRPTKPTSREALMVEVPTTLSRLEHQRRGPSYRQCPDCKAYCDCPAVRVASEARPLRVKCRKCSEYAKGYGPCEHCGYINDPDPRVERVSNEATARLSSWTCPECKAYVGKGVPHRCTGHPPIQIQCTPDATDLENTLAIGRELVALRKVAEAAERVFNAWNEDRSHVNKMMAMGTAVQAWRRADYPKSKENK